MLSAFLPALLSISLAAPALPQPVSRGLSFGPATALEGTGTAESDDQSGSGASSDSGKGSGSGVIGDASESLYISNKSPKQGEAVEVRVPVSGLTVRDLPQLQVLGKSYNLFPIAVLGKQFYSALFAVPVVQKPGNYKVSLGSLSSQITVKDAHFQVQRLSLPKSKDNFITAPGEEEAVDKAKATLSAERMWTAHFVKPSRARTSAPFGIRRIVNGKLLPDYFHSGLDFAASLGSPIYATAPGTVVLAQGGGVFKLHGNMVAIDHGQGVVSFYIHMQKVQVKVGQAVKAGEPIGVVGQTGRANGPALAFQHLCQSGSREPHAVVCQCIVAKGTQKRKRERVYAKRKGVAPFLFGLNSDSEFPGDSF